MVIDGRTTIGVIGGTGKLGAAFARRRAKTRLHRGALTNSAAAKAMTAVLIFLNRNCSVDGAGSRIPGELDMTANP